MAKTIYLSDGTMPTLFTSEDFFLLVEEHMGRDAATLARALADELDPESVNEIICKGDHF